MKKNHIKVLVFGLLTLSLLVFLIVSPSTISNDGRHYLSAAEALKEGGAYSSLGRSQSVGNLKFMDDWPPVYSGFTAVTALLFDTSVVHASKLFSLFIFVLTAMLVWVNFKGSAPIWVLLGMLVFMVNSGQYYSTDAEIFFLPALLFVFWKKDFFIRHPFLLGLLAGGLYLTKYSFLFIVPAFLLYLFFNKEGISAFKIPSRKVVVAFVQQSLLYLGGFFLSYTWWHYNIYKSTGKIYPGFLDAAHTVSWYQYFPDLIITWNLLPERFEYMGVIPGALLLIGIVLFIFYDSIKSAGYFKKLSFSQLFWHIPILGMLSFFLLEAILYGNSTKRYLEFSDLLFFIILCTALPALPWGRAYRYLAFAFMLVQVLYFFRVTIPRLPSLSLANMRENPVYQDMNERLANGEIERLYVIDLSFAGGVVNFENWDKVEKITVDGIPNPGERGFFLIQKRDMEKIRFAPPQARIIFVDR
jgi:hypothetical protein